MNVSLTNTRVLVVDDNADIRNLLRGVLEQYGAAVVVAHSVDGAIEEFRRCPAHAVITDIRLGSCDGFELLDEIRKCNLEYKGFTPVVALTGYASAEDEQRAIAAGFDAYLGKPVEADNIVDVVIRALNGSMDLAA